MDTLYTLKRVLASTKTRTDVNSTDWLESIRTGGLFNRTGANVAQPVEQRFRKP